MSTVVLIAALMTAAQAQGAEIRGSVVDISGIPVPDATVVLIVAGVEQPIPLADDATFNVPASGGQLRVRAGGFTEVMLQLDASTTGPLRVVLQPASFADTVVVTADRGATRLPSAASATVLSSAESTQ